MCYDFSLPLKDCFNFVDHIKSYLGDKVIRVFGFGHLGMYKKYKLFSFLVKGYQFQIRIQNGGF